MELRDNFVGVFKLLANDTELINLLEIPSTSMQEIKKQIIEDRYPDDLTLDNLSRLCVYENPSSPTKNPMIERGWIEVDIYVHRDKQRIDRRALLVAEKVIKLLHKAKVSGLDGLRYYNRLPNLPTSDPNWFKYGVVFHYDIIIN